METTGFRICHKVMCAFSCYVVKQALLLSLYSSKEELSMSLSEFSNTIAGAFIRVFPILYEFALVLVSNWSPFFL